MEFSRDITSTTGEYCVAGSFRQISRLIANAGPYLQRRTLARAKELEAKERAEIRQSLQADHAAHRPHRRFSEDDDVNAAATILARDEEERIGFDDLDDDNVDLDLDDDSDHSPASRWKKKTGRQSYHDEFTDNDSDDFRNEGHEAYGLHSHVQRET